MKRVMNLWESVLLSKISPQKKPDPCFSLVDLSERLAEELILQGQERTAEAYRSSVKSFLKFAGDEDFPLHHFSEKIIKSYQESMWKEGRTRNTTSFYCRNLRAMYNKGVKRKWLQKPEEDFFANAFTGVEKTSKKALREDSIRAIKEKVEEIKKIRDVPTRDLMSSYYFLFCFYACGMSFVDMAYLRKENICNGVIVYQRKKTGGEIRIKLIPQLRQILDFFAPMVKDSPYLFPIIKGIDHEARKQYQSALRQQNRMLKRIALECHIGTCVSTHAARHSWATIARRENIPLPVICESLGHASEKTTRIYLASFEEDILNKANRRVARAIQKHI